MFQKFHEIF